MSDKPTNTQTDEMTKACQDGQTSLARETSGHFYSSPLWFAFQAGRQVRAMSTVTRCRMGRGYSVRVEAGGETVLVKFAKTDFTSISVERV